MRRSIEGWRNVARCRYMNERGDVVERKGRDWYVWKANTKLEVVGRWLGLFGPFKTMREAAESLRRNP